MTYEQWAATLIPFEAKALARKEIFKAGAASRDAEIAYLLEANRIACEDLVEQQNLRVKYAGQIEELAAALEQLTTYDCRPSNIWKFFYPSSTGDYVNLIEFREKLAAALAKVRKPT